MRTPASSLRVTCRAPRLFLHRLEQRRLGLWRGAVDLVGEQQFAEDRPARERELAGLEVEQVRTQNIARQQIGGELDAPEIKPQRGGEALREEGLGGARRPFQQRVALRQRGDQQVIDQRVLADNRLGGLGADILGQNAQVFKAHRGDRGFARWGSRHWGVISFWSGGRREACW